MIECYRFRACLYWRMILFMSVMKKKVWILTELDKINVKWKLLIRRCFWGGFDQLNMLSWLTKRSETSKILFQRKFISWFGHFRFNSSQYHVSFQTQIGKIQTKFDEISKRDSFGSKISSLLFVQLQFQDSKCLQMIFSPNLTCQKYKAQIFLRKIQKARESQSLRLLCSVRMTSRSLTMVEGWIAIQSVLIKKFAVSSVTWRPPLENISLGSLRNLDK